MKQRDIFLADLEPTKGQEQQGVRPVVILSGNTMNEHFDLCMICPLSSKVKNFSTCLVLQKSVRNGLAQDSEVLTFQLRSISKKRLHKKIGEISEEELEQVFSGLNDVLRY